jgi:polar amino acid transport system ATP-binding protein
MADRSLAVDVRELRIDLGQNRVLEDVSFACSRGELTLLTGPSGTGKSTLLRAVNGICPISAGRIWTLGSCLPGRTGREARSVWRQTGTVLQEVALFETKSARGNVEVALRAAGFGRAAARREAVVWLERVGLPEKIDDYPWQLSGGQRQRVALARALAARPALLLLDEPTSALDRETARIVIEAIRELADGGTAVVMSSHRDDEMDGICDQRIALDNGRLVERGANVVSLPPVTAARSRPDEPAVARAADE